MVIKHYTNYTVRSFNGRVLFPFASPLLRLEDYEFALASTRPVSFQVNPSNCPKHPQGWLETLSLRDLLFCCGVGLAPSTSPNNRAAWGFMVEHLDSFAAGTDVLRLVDEARNWDPRITTLFAERLGIGATLWLLWNNFDVVHIADAGPFIGHALKKHGPYKGLLLTPSGKLKPDLFCLSPTGEVVIAESKGAVGPPSAVSASTRKKAKDQVKSVKPSGISVRKMEGRLTFSTTIRYENENARETKDTSTFVQDPDGNDDALNVPLNPDQLTLHSYLKFLNFMGVNVFLLRFELLDGEEIDGRKILFLGSFLGLRIGILEKVLSELYGPTQGLHQRISEALADAKLSEVQSEGFVLPNGIIAIPISSE